MSVVLVTGGTGVLGRHLVEQLTPHHEVRVLSRRPGAQHRGDLVTGEGLAAAASGVDVVVHAASDTRRLGRTDETQTRTLLGAVPRSARVLYVSIVGVDRLPYRYYRRKLACERLVAASGQPHTIVRIVQFHELIAAALVALERLPIVPLPTDFRFQTIAASEAAAAVAAAVDGPGLATAPDVGGPQVLLLRDMVSTWQEVRERPRRVARVRLPGRVAAGFRAGLNTTPANTVGQQTWQEFVQGLPR